MTEKMLQFTHLPQKTPAKRQVVERRADFDEIYKRFDVQAASQQASRCSQCGIPFCSIHCPLSNNIPDWLKLTAEGRLEEAYELSSATNTFPEICGRICPQDRLCEGNCVIEKGFESVTIASRTPAISRHHRRRPGRPRRRRGVAQPRLPGHHL
jgi:glutamate synthase (NADPH/NADH) small chain